MMSGIHTFSSTPSIPSLCSNSWGNNLLDQSLKPESCKFLTQSCKHIRRSNYQGNSWICGGSFSSTKFNLDPAQNYCDNARRWRTPQWLRDSSESALHYHSHWKRNQDAVSWIKISKAQDQGLQFWQTMSFSIINENPVPGDCIFKVISESGDRVLFERLSTLMPAPKVMLKSNWLMQQQQLIRNEGVNSASKGVAKWESQLRIRDRTEDVRGGTRNSPGKSVQDLEPKVEQKSDVDIDLGVQGVAQDTILQEEMREINQRVNKVKANKISIRNDMAKDEMIFSEESSRAIYEMGNMAWQNVNVDNDYDPIKIRWTESEKHWREPILSRCGQTCFPNPWQQNIIKPDMHFWGDALRWQRARFKNMVCEARTLTNMEDQCWSALDSRKHEVPEILMKSRTRQDNTLDPELQKFLEWLSFHLAEYFAEPQHSERQQSSSSSSWSPTKTWWSSSSRNHNWQEWHSKRMARPRLVESALKKSGNCNGETCASCFNCWDQPFLAQPVATCVNATGGAHSTPAGTHACARFFSCTHDCSLMSHWCLAQGPDDSMCFRKTVSSRCHESSGSAWSSISFDFPFTTLFSDATFRLVYLADWNQKSLLCLRSTGWNVWPSGQSDLTHKSFSRTRILKNNRYCSFLQDKTAVQYWVKMGCISNELSDRDPSKDREIYSWNIPNCSCSRCIPLRNRSLMCIEFK